MILSRFFGRNDDFVEGQPAGAPRDYADAKRLSLIDPHIRELVQAMNVPGVASTLAACEGHRYLLSGCTRPYVLFRAENAVAARLGVLIENDLMSDARRLRYHWELTGHFWNADLRWTLDIQDLDRHFWVTRRRLDADMAVLRDMVAIAFGPQTPSTDGSEPRNA